MTQAAKPIVEVDEETNITEITIRPDGRIYVFGLSRQVLQILENLRPGEPHLAGVLAHVRAVEPATIQSTTPPS